MIKLNCFDPVNKENLSRQEIMQTMIASTEIFERNFYPSSANLLFETMQTYVCSNRFDIVDSPEFFVSVFLQRPNSALIYQLNGVDMTAFCIY